MNFLKVIYAGLIATAVMTVFMLLGPFIGMPAMNKAGELLGKVYGGIEWMGWLTHVVIGVVMVIPYVLIFNRWVPVENKTARGLIYGLLVFVFSEVIITAYNMSGYYNSHEKELMGSMVFGNAIAFMIYGAVLGSFYERTGPDAMEENKREE